MTITIVIADDHKIFRESLRLLLKHHAVFSHYAGLQKEKPGHARIRAKRAATSG